MEENMKYKVLWLDDFRDPSKEMHFGWFPGYSPDEVFWVKNYNEFRDYIIKNGLPELICFDHDLADEHMEDFREQKEFHGDSKMIHPQYDKFTEMTGYDAAKWLIEYCLDKDVKLPRFVSQSANIVGKENILAVLNNFNRNRWKYNDGKPEYV
jgi:hypothetical protein